MNTNTMELNPDQMNAAGGELSTGDCVVKVLQGTCQGMFYGGLAGAIVGCAVGGAAIGSVGGAVVGGVVGGIAGHSGIDDAIYTTKTVIKIKLADL